MKTGGCITRRWNDTLDVSVEVLNLLSNEPELSQRFERLHAKHDRRLPRVLGWDQHCLTGGAINSRYYAGIRTSCTRARGLESTCWLIPARTPKGRRK